MALRISIRRWQPVAALLAVTLLALGACTSGGDTAKAPGASRPNIVFVLTDDLSMNLLPYMPHVQALAKAGTSFSNYTVTDSLCCPSRSSLFTGMFPHDTGVFTNGGEDGGFNVFHQRGDEKSTFATSLRDAGYRTAMMGKYLNGYLPKTKYVPPGWDEWDVAGNGYPEFDYNLNENHSIKHYGKTPTDYLTDVLSAKGSNFITSSSAAHKPFMLEVATFAPHAPYTPAPQDAAAFPGLKAPRSQAFDTLPAAAPPWLAQHVALTAKQQQTIDAGFRKRVQAVQAVDRMVASLQATLGKAGVAKDTVVVFSSDNGYHMGEYRLTPGKMTAFDTDVNVPLIAAGPNVRAGATVTDPAENIDLRPTFEALAGAKTPADVDGHSLVPLLESGEADGWRTGALVEHHGPDTDQTDPDLPAPGSGNPTTYEALRTTSYTYVEYSDGSREYYDRTKDRPELHNLAGQLPSSRIAGLHTALLALSSCHGQAACWTAAHVPA